MKRSILTLSVIAGLLACDAKPQAPATTEPAKMAEKAPSQAPSVPPTTDVEVSVVTDFEAEAETQITEANYEAELDKIAAEIE